MVAAFAVTVYFVHRIDYVLSEKGIDLSETSYADIMHLQVQFMLGIMSLMVLMVLFLVLNRHYNSYMAYEGKIDFLTSAMTRRAFFSACSRALKSVQNQTSPLGYFIMVDLDRFKEINDQYGHPEGDRALQGVAHCLKETMGERCIIGRMGGDEFIGFAVHVSQPDKAVDRIMERLYSWLDEAEKDGFALHCSVGVFVGSRKSSYSDFYRMADQALYAAKRAGKNKYRVIREGE